MGLQFLLLFALVLTGCRRQQQEIPLLHTLAIAPRYAPSRASCTCGIRFNHVAADPALSQWSWFQSSRSECDGDGNFGEEHVVGDV